MPPVQVAHFNIHGQYEDFATGTRLNVSFVAMVHFDALTNKIVAEVSGDPLQLQTLQALRVIDTLVNPDNVSGTC